MDSVRFGRVLGVGARVAARTLVNAVDAATSPNPSAEPAPSKTVAQATQQAARTATQTAAQVKQTGQGLAQGSRRFGESFWGQVTRLSGVLWLEFTGVFFGIFALYGASGAWKLRGNLHRTATNQDAHAHFLLLAGMAALFGYFCVTSFLRAGRRGRRKV